LRTVRPSNCEENKDKNEFCIEFFLRFIGPENLFGFEIEITVKEQFLFYKPFNFKTI
jgi:hypothetical protein